MKDSTQMAQHSLQPSKYNKTRYKHGNHKWHTMSHCWTKSVMSNNCCTLWRPINWHGPGKNGNETNANKYQPISNTMEMTHNTGSTTEGDTNKNAGLAEANYETREWLGAGTCILGRSNWLIWTERSNRMNPLLHWQTKSQTSCSQRDSCRTMENAQQHEKDIKESINTQLDKALKTFKNEATAIKSIIIVESQRPKFIMKNLSSVVTNRKLHSMTLLKHENQKWTHSNRNYDHHKWFMFKTQYQCMWIFQQWIVKWDWVTRVLIHKQHQLCIHDILSGLLQIWGCRILGKQNVNTHLTCKTQTTGGKIWGNMRSGRPIQQDILRTTWPSTKFARHIPTLSLKNNIDIPTLQINKGNSSNAQGHRTWMDHFLSQPPCLWQLLQKIAPSWEKSTWHVWWWIWTGLSEVHYILMGLDIFEGLMLQNFEHIGFSDPRKAYQKFHVEHLNCYGKLTHDNIIWQNCWSKLETTTSSIH